MMVRLLCLALVGVCAADQVQANPVIDPPVGRTPEQRSQPLAPRQVALTIEPGPGQETRLIVPARMLKGWQAAAASTNSPVQTAGLSSVTLPTILAGLALTTGLALGGLWLRRPRLRRQLLGGFACVLAGVLILSVGGCPLPSPEIRTYEKPIDAPTFKSDNTLTGQVLLETDDRADTLRLVVNREALAKLGGQSPAPSNP
jgi:hypothetical protein